MRVSEYSFLIVTVTTVLSILDLSCAHDPLETSTQPVLAATPSHDLPQWTVTDDDNRICMIMAMKATIQQLDTDIPIPSTATATQQAGSCDSKTALFTLKWISEEGISFKVTTAFKVHGNSYKMVEVNGTESQGFSFSSWSNEDSSFPSASIGNSMTCQEFDSGTVYFTNYQFQPFAQQSNEEYGKAEACSFGLSLWVYVVFVAIVIVVVVVVAVIVLVIVKVVKSKPSYREMQ